MIKEETERTERNIIKSLKPKVKSLVIELRRLGIETVWSCQGYTGWGNNFPWICVAIKDLDRVKIIVNLYNKTVEQSKEEKNRIFWTILNSPAALIPNMQGKNFSLEELQESALNFAETLKELNYVPEEIKHEPQNRILLGSFFYF
ncbi:MAG: hypothetical protein NTU58_04050 [Candidatus Nealsonbacteria bacterium]|nr:hypothetical protein [Candidatus Nealsonbacteria bacterium]